MGGGGCLWVRVYVFLSIGRERVMHFSLGTVYMNRHKCPQHGVQVCIISANDNFSATEAYIFWRKVRQQSRWSLLRLLREVWHQLGKEPNQCKSMNEKSKTIYTGLSHWPEFALWCTALKMLSAVWVLVCLAVCTCRGDWCRPAALLSTEPSLWSIFLHNRQMTKYPVKMDPMDATLKECITLALQQGEAGKVIEMKRIQWRSGVNVEHRDSLWGV